ncbi:hypothetical protein NLU13_4204 [Sarocladium strictum]|uniref:Uncharacterized protein n=1 Tax=Sarocladium strictum TaxID=5046 RepID=A0AA39GIG4_SARSR|nr:hypothetical protein NLU13_4204 [Sarocladium strictum]
MPRHIHVEAKSSKGTPQFVTCSRSHSDGHKHKHHHNHNHHHHHRDVVKVDRSEWEALREREHTLADSNKSFALENNTLKASLSATQQERHRLVHGVIPQIQSQVAAANDQAQRHYREAERQHQRALRLESENKELRAESADLRTRVTELRRQLDASMGRRVAELLKEVEYWKDQYRRMKTKHDAAWRQYDDLCASVRLKSEKLAVYEDILRRGGLI